MTSWDRLNWRATIFESLRLLSESALKIFAASNLFKKQRKALENRFDRRTLQNSGIAPENLPISEDVNKVKTRLKSANRRMLKLDSARILSTKNA